MSTPPPVPDPAPVTDPAPVRPGNVLPFPTRFAPDRGDGLDGGSVDGAADETDHGPWSSLVHAASAGQTVGDPADEVDPTDDPDGITDHRDWAWVEEWRSGNEPTPWAAGLAMAAFAALVVGIAVVVLSSGLSANPVIAVVINLLVAAGLVPAIWLSRELPVLRWIGLGAAVGVIGGWITAVGLLAG